MSIQQPRILCLFSAPLVAPDDSPLAALDLETERDTIVRELAACNQSILLRIGFATIDELARNSRDNFNILHLSGHGHPEYLLFEDGKGGSQPVTGDYLKRLIGTGGAFELAIVSACHSEKIAEMLVEAGVRHVIAIRCDVPVLDRAATVFIGNFYRDLFRGDSLQKAFEMARLLVEGNPDLMKIKPQLELIAYEKGEPFVPEEKKFVLLPDEPSFHLNPLFSQEIPQGSLSIEEPRLSKTNLPVRPHSFTGRSIEMYCTINELLAARIVTLTGAGGIGKTWLAMEVARWFRSRGYFPDGIFHVDLRHVTTASGAIAQLDAALEVQLTELEDLVAYIGERQYLLLLDNAEDALLQDENAVQDLIDSVLKFTPHVKFLITSQRPVGGNLYEPEHVCRIYPLKEYYASLLFLATTKRRMSENEWKSETFHNLLQKLGGHPLSIVLMARQLVHGTSLEDLIERIEKYKAKAIEVKSITDRDLEHGESLVASLASAYDGLSDDGKTLFKILSMLPAGAQDFTLQAILGPTAWEYVQELNDASLAEVVPSRRVILLPPVGLFAASVLTEDIREHYGPQIVKLMGLYAKQFYEYLGAEDAKDYRFFFTLEEPNLRSAVELPDSSPKSTEEVSNLGLLAPYLISLYLHHDRCTTAKEIGDTIIIRLEKLRDQLGQANTLQALGDLAMRTADLKGAKERYERALEIFQQIGENLGEAYTLRALGDLAMRTADLKGAKERYERALEIFQQIGASLGEANTLRALGLWFVLSDELDDAETNFDTATSIYKRIEDLEGQADVHMGKAFIHVKRHDNTAARNELDQCASIRDKVLAHGEAAQWLIFYADHFTLHGLHEGALICLECAERFASTARDHCLQDQIRKRLSEVE